MSELQALAGELTPAEDSVTAAADRLRRASHDRIPCAPVRDLLGSTEVALAYRVQHLLAADRLAAGRRIVGHKIGLTSLAVQRQLGVDQPDSGLLFDDMLVPDGGLVPAGRLLQPKAEAEIAFVLASDLDRDDITVAAVRAAIGYAVAALEIPDSRVRGWDIAITDTVADNASSGMFVLGSTRAGLDEFEPAEVTMTMTKDGAAASAGAGRDCLGDPLKAVCWLARTVRTLGSPLRAGQIVLSGALGPMVDAGPGCTVAAELSVLGRVSAAFAR